MKSAFVSLAALCLACQVAAAPADDSSAKPTPAAAAPRQDPAPAPPPQAVAATTPGAGRDGGRPGAAGPVSPSDKARAKTAKAGTEPVTVLPKVEVRKRKITELDRQLQEKDEEIAAEQEKTQATEMDKALNNSKVAGALAIFGGSSSDARESVAKERVSLLEAEKDLLQEIAHAKTKEEKETLQKELAEFKAMRRELEQMPK